MAEQEEAQFQADLARALELSLQTAAQETTRRDSQLAGGSNIKHFPFYSCCVGVRCEVWSGLTDLSVI